MRPFRLAAVLSLLACAVGCEIGEPPLALGENLKLIRYTPQDSEGIACDYHSTSCGVPANRPLTFQFDQWLLPKTVARQSLSLSVDQAPYGHFLWPTYELLTRTVTFWPSSPLPAGLVHILELADSETAPNGWGFKAYDGRPLERGSFPEAIVFRTRPSDPDIVRVATVPRLCRDALAAFAKGGCTAAHCHRGSDDELPRANLRLDGKSGLAAAMGRVALATDRSGDSGRMTVNPARFGMNLPVLDAGQPSLSFLLYRVLLGRDAYRNASGRFEVKPPSEQELETATTWFGAIGPMPPESVGFPDDVSPVELTRTLESWLADGADTEYCD